MRLAPKCINGFLRVQASSSSNGPLKQLHSMCSHPSYWIIKRCNLPRALLIFAAAAYRILATVQRVLHAPCLTTQLVSHVSCYSLGLHIALHRVASTHVQLSTPCLMSTGT